MSNTQLLAPLSSTFMQSTLEDVAFKLGESVKSVTRGMELSAATVFSGLSRKSGDSDTLRQVIDLAANTPANALVAGVSDGQIADPQSPVMSSSRSFLSSLFGGSQDSIQESIARESGLRTGAAGTMLALGTQWVLSFIGSRVRDEGMTPGMLSNLLQSEGPRLRHVLPASVNSLFASSPASVQPVTKARSSSSRSWLLPLAAILAAVLWLAYRQGGVPVSEVPKALAPAVSTITRSVNALGDMIPRTLSDGTVLSVPALGVEGRLLNFIGDSRHMPDTTTWFDFDRLLFDTGSATLRPESQEQLRNVASIMGAYPNVNLKIGGYTDNVGPPAQNMQLSQERAGRVMSALVGLGVSENRLTAEGYGEQHPIGDNTTEAGRAMNRRISMLVTQK